MSEDKLIETLNKASHYERIIVHGFWGNGELNKHLTALMRGEHIRFYVPQQLAPVMSAESIMEDETVVEVAEFRAVPMRAQTFYVYGSLRPWNDDSWVLVGRIN